MKGFFKLDLGGKPRTMLEATDQIDRPAKRCNEGVNS